MDMNREEIVAGMKQCAVFRADYMECLHGEKTLNRRAAVAKAQQATSTAVHH
jgi:hypothetical protein